MANASKLLHTETDPENYLATLEPEDSRIREARTKIRVHLRAAFEASSEALFGRVVRPRFFTQGSFAYKTLNDPAHPPDQQMDLDDGCYLPLSFVRGTRPSTAAEKFFEFVDAALDELAEREGWGRESKPTCCRVVIAYDSHVDIPLYAIPNNQFHLLEDRRSRAANASAEFAQKRDSWADLPSDEVLLAHRDEGWKESDPRKIHKWFTDGRTLSKGSTRDNLDVAPSRRIPFDPNAAWLQRCDDRCLANLYEPERRRGPASVTIRCSPAFPEGKRGKTMPSRCGTTVGTDRSSDTAIFLPCAAQTFRREEPP